MQLPETFEAQRARAERLVGVLSEGAFNWKHASEAWSVGECLVHLNRTAACYLPALEVALARGGPAGLPPFRYGWLAEQLIRYVGPEVPLKMPAPGIFRPAASGGSASRVERDATLAAFVAFQHRLLAVCERGEGLNLAALKLRLPTVPLRLSAGAVLEIVAAHQERHLNQAERVTAHPRFPTA